MQTRVLINGFPGRPDRCGLSWSSIALIEDGDTKILVDNGAYMARKPIYRFFAANNLKFQDIDIVLLTHLHYDHVENCDLFSNALFVTSVTEWEYAQTTDDLPVRKMNIDFLKSMRKRLVIQDMEEVYPGIKAMFTPGHTPGSLSYVLDMDGENWIIAGDALKNRGQIACNPAIGEERTEEERSINKIVSKADRIFPGHDCWLKRDNGWFKPVEENTVKIAYDGDLTINGCNPITLKID